MPRKIKTQTEAEATTEEVKKVPDFQLIERDGQKWILFNDADNSRIAREITQAIAYYGESEDSELTDGAIRVTTLAANEDAIQRYMRDHVRGGLTRAKGVLALVKGEVEALRTVARERLKNNEAKFFDLNLVFHEGVEIYDGSGDAMFGGVVQSVKLRRTFFGTYWQVEVASIGNGSGKVGTFTRTLSIGEFEGVVDLGKLPVKLMTEAVKAQLTVRGENFRRYCNGSHHVAYTGTMLRQAGWSSREYRATGRVMVDIEALKQVEPNLFRHISYGYDRDEDDADIAGARIPDADLWKTSPYLYGFSFVAKTWGRFDVSALAPIQWRRDAFDKLVLPSEEKEMIRALVEHNSGSFTDIVDGKGGGCIFLLHGPPGQGKTLTAETVSELLEKPLYMISVGELGTNPDELESRLRTILDIATLWDAVLLLDEADIFLEARDESNIVRNAMVGVFLRLLEYHQGVLFLTSNRAKNIDSAFYSRISVALRFAEATHAKREKIWTNLLESAGIEGLTVSKLAEAEINGRQIKTAIRLAQTLAKSRDEVITQQLVERTINLGARFERD